MARDRRLMTPYGAPREDDSVQTRLALVWLHACAELDRSPVRGAQIGALPLLLALVELRASDGAVFHKHPLERGEHSAKVGFAVVGGGFERLNLTPERLGPARGRDCAAFDDQISKRERFSVPRLAERWLAVLGLEKA